jgi:hypothetical protein
MQAVRGNRQARIYAVPGPILMAYTAKGQFATVDRTSSPTNCRLKTLVYRLKLDRRPNNGRPQQSLGVPLPDAPIWTNVNRCHVNVDDQCTAYMPLRLQILVLQTSLLLSKLA